MSLPVESAPRAARALTPSSVAPVPRYRNPIRVLQEHRNFRLFWLGQTSSVIGTWMQTVAQGWLALELTNSAFMVGFVSAADSLPVLLLTLYAGVLADRHDKLRLVLLTQALFLVQAATLWWFDWSGRVTIVALTLLALLAGVVNAFDIPTRQSLIVELVGREDIVDAIALNSSGFNLARIVGPSIAAIVIDRAGLAWCFALNAASYLFVLAALARIRLPAHQPRVHTASPIEGMREGLRFMLRTRSLTLLMVMVAALSVFGIPFLVLMPVVARDVLHGGARAYGLLLAAVGVGAVLGAVVLATTGHTMRRGRWLAISALSFCVLLLAFSFARSLWLATLLLGGVGFAMIQTNALANGLLQTLAPDELRGRVMSAYAFVFVGLNPVGALLAGSLAEVAGAPAAIGAGAVVLLLVSAWVLGVRREVSGL